jgi:ABC-type Mn2+/Zn2+ transport system permease subunit
LIAEFVDSWHLFQDTYLAGWLMGILLAVVGVLVVARDQIFIGAALAEASTLGIAVGMWLGSLPAFHEETWMHGDAFLTALAAVFALLAAFVSARGATARQSQEALAGWIFLFGGSVSILVVYYTPHGLEEVHRLLSTSIIGASRTEVWMFAAAALAALIAVAVARRRLVLLLMDPEMAEALGMRRRAWEAGIACVIALTVSLCIRASGLPYTFGCLVLPALAASSLCRSPASVFAAAPAICVLTAAAAFVIANHLNEPPGQVAVALLCAVTALAAGWRRLAGAS